MDIKIKEIGEDMPRTKVYDITEDKLRVQSETMTAKEIADTYGCTLGTVYHYLKEYGLRIKNKKQTRKSVKPNLDRDTLARMMSDGMSDEEMAKAVGIATTTFIKCRYAYGIYRSRSKVDDEVLYALKKQGMTNRQMAEVLGCSPSAVNNHMVFVRARHPEIPKKSPRVMSISKNEMQALIDEGLNDEQIARRLGKTVMTVWKTRVAYEIEDERRRQDEHANE